MTQPSRYKTRVRNDPAGQPAPAKANDTQRVAVSANGSRTTNSHTITGECFRNSQGLKTRSLAVQPSQQAARTSSTTSHSKVKDSSFSKFTRPRPFAPKREITTRNASPAVGKKPEEPNSSKSIVPAPGTAKRAAAIGGDSAQASATPIFDSLSQHDPTPSSAAKLESVQGHAETARRETLRDVVAGRAATIKTSLHSPRISSVGEDFVLNMQGDSGNCLGSVGNRTLSDKQRQDSGGIIQHAEYGSSQQNKRHTLDPATMQRMTSNIGTSADDYSMDFSGLDWISCEMDQALNAPASEQQSGSGEGNSNTNEEPPRLQRCVETSGPNSVADKVSGTDTTTASSTIRAISTATSKEELRSMVQDAVKDALVQQIDAGAGSGRDLSMAMHATTAVARRQGGDPVGLRSRAMNALGRLFSPFRLHNSQKPGQSARRPRRRSTGSVGGRPVITPDMANPGREIYNRPILNHANSLRPEHSPHLYRNVIINGQSQFLRVQTTVPVRRRSAKALIDFPPLTTCEEEGLEDAQAQDRSLLHEFDAKESEIPVDEADTVCTGLEGVDEEARIARAEHLQKRHEVAQARRASDARRAGYFGRGDRAGQHDSASSRGGRGGVTASSGVVRQERSRVRFTE